MLRLLLKQSIYIIFPHVTVHCIMFVTSHNITSLATTYIIGKQYDTMNFSHFIMSSKFHKSTCEFMKSLVNLWNYIHELSNNLRGIHEYIHMNVQVSKHCTHSFIHSMHIFWSYLEAILSTLWKSSWQPFCDKLVRQIWKSVWYII